jgi:hypothetical protein
LTIAANGLDPRILTEDVLWQWDWKSRKIKYRLLLERDQLLDSESGFLIENNSFIQPSREDMVVYWHAMSKRHFPQALVFEVNAAIRRGDGLWYHTTFQIDDANDSPQIDESASNRRAKRQSSEVQSPTSGAQAQRARNTLLMDQLHTYAVT